MPHTAFAGVLSYHISDALRKRVLSPAAHAQNVQKPARGLAVAGQGPHPRIQRVGGYVAFALPHIHDQGGVGIAACVPQLHHVAGDRILPADLLRVGARLFCLCSIKK